MFGRLPMVGMCCALDTLASQARSLFPAAIGLKLTELTKSPPGLIQPEPAIPTNSYYSYGFNILSVWLFLFYKLFNLQQHLETLNRERSLCNPWLAVSQIVCGTWWREKGTWQCSLEHVHYLNLAQSCWDCIRILGELVHSALRLGGV